MGFIEFVMGLRMNYVTFQVIINKVILAFIILIIGLIVGRLAGKFIEKILKELEVSKVLKKATKRDFVFEERVGNLVKYLVYFFGIVIALNQLGLTSTLLTLLAGAVLLIIILAFLLAVKDYIPNLIAGFRIYKNQMYKKGDTIEIDGVKGEVMDIKLIETKIKKGSDMIYIPNSTILKGNLKVHS